MLVVDGDPAVRQRIVEELGQRGAKVVGTAMGCRTGLPKIESYRPDVVVVDLVTESVEGAELLERLHEQDLTQRVVALAGKDVDGPRAARARALGAFVVARPAGGDGHQLSTVVDVACAPLRSGPRKPSAPASRPEPQPQPEPQAEPERRASARDVAPAAERAPSAPPEAPAPPRPTPRRVAPVDPPHPASPRVRQRAVPATAAAPAARAATPVPRRRAGPIEVVGIGISTGGPKALNDMLPLLPADLRVPVLIVQHMPPVFTASLAESLARRCAVPVREAVAGEAVLPGEVLIAPGGQQMRVSRGEQGVVVRLTDDPPENSCRPAVDYLFRSLAEVYGAATCAVIMTGMGEDGFAGCRQLHALGATLVAQDAQSCTVYGMPRGPIEAGIVDYVEPLEQLAARITAITRGDRTCN